MNVIRSYRSSSVDCHRVDRLCRPSMVQYTENHHQQYLVLALSIPHPHTSPALSPLSPTMTVGVSAPAVI